jgi:hypothetical protein
MKVKAAASKIQASFLPVTLISQIAIINAVIWNRMEISRTRKISTTYLRGRYSILLCVFSKAAGSRGKSVAL